MEVTRLIERCRQGDADALGELYKAYAQRMRGVCRRYVSDEQAIGDVLHDAFALLLILDYLLTYSSIAFHHRKVYSGVSPLSCASQNLLNASVEASMLC